MPGRSLAFFRRFGKKTRVPKCEVRTQDRLDQIQDLENPRVVQKTEIVGQHVRTLIQKFRMLFQQPLVVRTDLFQGLLVDSEIRDDEPVLMVAFDF